MFGIDADPRDASRDEAEKPFWISFADLMTALMILFLIIMVIALINVKRQSDQIAAKEKALASQSQQFQKYKEKDLQARQRIALQRQFRTSLSAKLPAGVSLHGDIIEWGDRMRFANGSSTLTPEQQAILRSDIKPLLKQATGPLGVKVLRRFVLEGFASNTGSYLLNLNLSLDRSQRVICSLLDDTPSSGPALSSAERQQVVDLFLISGYSSNAAKRSEEASRRVELRLEWWNQKPDKDFHPPVSNVGTCALGG